MVYFITMPRVSHTSQHTFNNINNNNNNNRSPDDLMTSFDVDVGSSSPTVIMVTNNDNNSATIIHSKNKKIEENYHQQVNNGKKLWNNKPSTTTSTLKNDIIINNTSKFSSLNKYKYSQSKSTWDLTWSCKVEHNIEKHKGLKRFFNDSSFNYNNGNNYIINCNSSSSSSSSSSNISNTMKESKSLFNIGDSIQATIDTKTKNARMSKESNLVPKNVDVQNHVHQDVVTNDNQQAVPTTTTLFNGLELDHCLPLSQTVDTRTIEQLHMV